MAMKRKARQSVNHLHDDSYTLGFFLQCNMDSESPSWTCHAQAKMRLLSWKEGVAPNERRRACFSCDIIVPFFVGRQSLVLICISVCRGLAYVLQ